MKALKIIFLVSIVFWFFLFIKATDLTKAFSSLQLVGANFIILLLVTFLAYLSATIGWRFCLGKDGKILSLSNLFFVRHIGEIVTLINPIGIVGGEAVKILLLNNRGIEKKTVITSVLISRVLMVITQLLLFLFATLAVATRSFNFKFNGPQLSKIIVPLVVTGFLVLAIVKARHAVIKVLDKTKIYLGVKERVKHWVIQLKLIWNESLLFFLHNKKALVWSMFYTMLHWILGSLEFFFILKFLGIKISILQSLFLDMGVVLFKVAGSFVPAQIGVEEFGNKVMLSFIGVVGPEVWITVSFLKRLRQLFWIALGLGFYLIIYKKHRNLLAST